MQPQLPSHASACMDGGEAVSCLDVGEVEGEEHGGRVRRGGGGRDGEVAGGDADGGLCDARRRVHEMISANCSTNLAVTPQL